MSAGSSTERDVTWPEPTGPHDVGVVRFQVTDPHRVETYAPIPRRGRRIHVSAWYPASADSGVTPRAYLTPEEVQALHASIPQTVSWPEDAWAHTPQLITASRPGAPVIETPSRTLPLLAFSHGGHSYAAQNTALMEELASHGYVVLSLGHPYESGSVLMEDGEAIGMSEEPVDDLTWVDSQPGFFAYQADAPLADRLAATRRKVALSRKAWISRFAEDWARDTMFVVDCLAEQRVPDAAGPIAEATSTDRVGYFGMSYGAYVAMRLCALDERAVAGVNLDSGMWDWSTVDTDFPTPLLVVCSDPVVQYRPLLEAAGIDVGAGLTTLSPATPLHCDLDFERLTEAGQRADIFRYILAGSMHMALTDCPVLWDGDETADLGVGPLAGPRGVDAVNRLCRDFFDTYLRGRDTEFPSGALQEFPEIVTRDLSQLRAEARAMADASQTGAVLHRA